MTFLCMWDSKDRVSAKLENIQIAKSIFASVHFGLDCEIVFERW